MSSDQSAQETHTTPGKNAGDNRLPAVNQFAVCLTDTVEAASSHLERLIPRLFETENSELNGLFTQHENSERTANAIFEEYLQFRQQQQSLCQHFINELTKLFNDSLNRGLRFSGQGGMGISGNRLLQSINECIQEQALMTNMSARAHKQYNPSLSALHKRITNICKNNSISKHALPLGPEQLCHAFKNALYNHKLSDELKLVLLELFDESVMHHLGPLYLHVNGILRDAGILPDLLFEQKVATGSKFRTNVAAPVATPVETPAESAIPSNNTVSTSNDHFGALKHLVLMNRHMQSLAEAPSITGRGTVESINKTTLTSEEMVQLLDSWHNMAQSILPANSYFVADASVLTAYIIDEACKNNKIVSRKISQDDEVAIELVCLLYQAFNEDKSLPDSMKDMLNDLQVTLLKLAVKDRSFFNNDQHPARSFINTLVSKSLCRNESKNIENDAYYINTGRLVSDINAIQNPSAASFDQAINELNCYLEKTDDDNGTTPMHDMDEADKTAYGLINSLIKDQELPAVIKQFLTRTWKNVLINIYINNGKDSQAWENAVKLTRDLVDSTQPKITDKEKQDLLHAIPGLIQAVQEGLTLVSCTREYIEAFLHDLEAIHMASLKGNLIDIYISATDELTLEDQADNDEDDINADKLIAEIEQATTRIDKTDIYASPSDIYHETIESLEIGTWLEFTEARQNKVRLKLAWKNKQNGEFTFVDQAGRIVAETPVIKLADDFRKGLIHIIDMSPITDRALTHIRRDLKKRVFENKKPA